MKRLAVVVALAVAAAPALAATKHEHHFTLAFTKKTPSTQTGVKFVTDRYTYKAPTPPQPVERVSKVTFVMAPGTHTNLTSFAKCTKAALEAKGPGACPKGSRVGSGKAVVITGLPIDPVNLTAQIFVKKGGLLAYLTGSGQTQIIEMSVKSNKIVAPVPRKCLDPKDCSKGEAVLKVLSVTINPGKLITTPRTCPAARKWTNTALYAYANGDTEKVTSTTPCKR